MGSGVIALFGFPKSSPEPDFFTDFCITVYLLKYYVIFKSSKLIMN